MHKGAPLSNLLMLSLSSILLINHRWFVLRGWHCDNRLSHNPLFASSQNSTVNARRRLICMCRCLCAPCSSNVSWRGWPDDGQTFGEASHLRPEQLPTSLKIVLATGHAATLNRTDIGSRGLFQWQSNIRPRLTSQAKRAC